MNNLNKLILAAGSLAFAHVGVAQFVAPDNYWGGTPNDPDWNGDIVGYQEPFDLTGGQVIQSNGSLTVNIFGNYFDNILSGENLWETEMGDLFISVDGLAWTEGGAATLNDYFQSPDSYTTWKYAVVLGKYIGSDLVLPQQGGLYSVESEDDIILSDPGPFPTYRADQEVWLDTTGQEALTSASWFIDNTGGENEAFLSITINNWDSLFGDVALEDLGFHWTMSCGNDVIEFPAVPEPSTVGMLGAAGLAGILLIRRKLVRRK